MRNIKVASTQINHKPGDKEYNLSLVEQMCYKAYKEGVQIISFPEMCITGYWHIRNLERKKLVELGEDPINGPTALKLKKLSIKYSLIIGCGIIELGDDSKLYNTFIVTQPDRPTSFHRKLHCFISKYMSSGDRYTVIKTSLGINLGVLICWDNNLVENVRSTTLLGADILLSPHQTGGCKSNSGNILGKIDTELWENRLNDPISIKKEFQGVKGREWLLRWLPSRAHDNGIFILFSNGVGRDDDEIRTGNAMVIDPFGSILNESKEICDDLIIAECNIELINSSLGRNWIKGRRPELYSELTRPKPKKYSIIDLKGME